MLKWITEWNILRTKISKLDSYTFDESQSTAKKQEKQITHGSTESRDSKVNENHVDTRGPISTEKKNARYFQKPRKRIAVERVTKCTQ